MAEKSNPKESISIDDICRNCFYLFKEAFLICKKFFCIYIILMAFVDAIDSVLVIVLYKYLIDCTNKSIAFCEVVFMLLIVGGGGGLLTIVCRSILSRIYEVKILEVSRKVNSKLFMKTVTMDIINYDKEEYYNKYIRAMENSEVQISATVKACTGLISMLMSILSLSGVLLLVDSKMFLFPLVACMVHLVCNLCITKLQYKLQREMTPLSRKKSYCRRVFYQPEYTKEMRLTDMFQAHIHTYREAIAEEIIMLKKYSVKIRLVRLINNILGWVLLVYYLPMQYLVYSAVVTTKLSLGDVAAMNESNQSLTNSIDNMTNNMVGLQEIGLFGGYYREFLDSTSELETRKGSVIEEDSPKEIKFDNVSFAYDEHHYVLKNINMSIKPGQKIAIVGYNGSGKSTLIKLLLNLYSVSEGCIYYDGKAIEEYECKSYRNNFGILFQDFQTYALSIKDNILMGDYDGKYLQESMQQARIYQKISSLTSQENSVLGQEFDEDGVLLSGGECQRLALARLFMGRKPILILDEHTSAMDPITEKEVNDKIFSTFKEHTIIYISHQLTSICNADYIYFLEHGEIVEEGTHHELLKLNKKYKNMFDKQASYFRI